eukprot:CAMPEP_0185042908 /NCGR_PEP_ID=MMETSP1103-20130426/42615_1 /TAXON_ID=36769 /ORGANISM="Paraphysomonas bandaiensis, Strain Caron Lab Isolate" /LENGTH=751 /DNA_ID=CAMNT_0027583039 /DNA_START=1243 /DNA_END=3498 /DNA_ORIENTATION=+
MKSGKTFSRQNDTLSTLYHGWQKPPEMKRHQGRDGVNTDLNTSIRSTAECAVMSGSVGILDFGDLMLKRNADGSIYINEIGDTVRCVNSGNGRARLHDFRSFGNLPFKSGHGRSHIQVETKMICHGVFGADANEIALPLDPEFGWQLMRLTQTLRDETRMMCPLPPPFHCGKHLTECHWRDPIFMIMLVIPLLQQLRMKSSVFNDQLQRNILEWIMSATASDFYSLDKCLALLRTDSTNEDGELDMPDVDEPEDDVEAGDDDEEDSVGSIRESIIAAMEDQKITQISGLREVEAIAEFASARHINMRAHSQEDKPKVKRFMAAQRELTKTWIINYKRMKYITEILFNAYEHIKEECEADFNANSLTMLMKYFLDVMLRVTVEKLIVDGDIEDFWRYLPAYCRLFAFGDKPRITRVFIYHLCIILHCKEKRPDWLRAIAGISTWTNEVYIEHANSVLARHLTSKSVTDDFTLTRLCSLLVDRIRCDKNSWRELQHVSQVGGESNSLLKKRRRDSTDAKLSEPAHQMRRFKHGGSDFNYARDIGNKVLKPLVQAYSRIKIPSKVSRVLDSYRPLQMATAIIPTHFKALDKFLSDVREEEARELIPNAGVIDECYYFLDKQVMGECLMPLTCFFCRPSQEMRRLWPNIPAFELIGNRSKAFVVPQLRDVLMRMANGNASDAVKLFCNMCICCDIKYRDVPLPSPDQLEAIRHREDKTRLIFDSGPSPEQSRELLSKASWNVQLAKELNLTQTCT